MQPRGLENTACNTTKWDFLMNFQNSRSGENSVHPAQLKAQGHGEREKKSCRNEQDQCLHPGKCRWWVSGFIISVQMVRYSSPLEMLKRSQFEPFQQGRISVLLTPWKVDGKKKMLVLHNSTWERTWQEDSFFLVLPTFPEYRPHASDTLSQSQFPEWVRIWGLTRVFYGSLFRF